MHVDIAWVAEQVVFEVVIFQIGDGVAHIVFARQEGLFPQHLAVAVDARHALDMGRQITDPQFGTKGAGAQLGMSQIEIVDAFGDVIGKFICQGKTKASWLTIVIDHVNSSDLGLLAGVERKSWGRDGVAWANH